MRGSRALLGEVGGGEAEQHRAVERRELVGALEQMDGRKPRLHRGAGKTVGDQRIERRQRGRLLEGGDRRREIVERAVEQAGDLP